MALVGLRMMRIIWIYDALMGDMIERWHSGMRLSTIASLPALAKTGLCTHVLLAS